MRSQAAATDKSVTSRCGFSILRLTGLSCACVCARAMSKKGESPNRVIKRYMVKPDELITGRQMGPRGTVGAEQHGEQADITHTRTDARARARHTHTHTPKACVHLYKQVRG